MDPLLPSPTLLPVLNSLLLPDPVPNSMFLPDPDPSYLPEDCALLSTAMLVPQQHWQAIELILWKHGNVFLPTVVSPG